MRHFLIIIFIIIALPCYAEEENPFVPWDYNKLSQEGENVTQKKTDTPFGGYFLIQTVKFYQHFISPVIGSRCPMYPSCSAYSIEAIEKHGALIGFVMTADRLIHEVNEQDHAPVIKKEGRWRYYDPVSNNDFWWYKQKNFTLPVVNKYPSTTHGAPPPLESSKNNQHHNAPVP